MSAQRSPRIPRSPSGWLLSTALLTLGVAVYRNSLSGAFLFDDYSCIPDNPHIRSLWPLTRVVASAPELAVAGRPLISLSLAINYALGALDVRGYHLVSLVLHLLAALLLFGIVRRTLEIRQPRRYDPIHARWLAFAAAALWMVHPLVTEAVDYIIQRTELFMACFLLLTLYATIRSHQAAHPRRWWALAIVSSVAGMMSKEVMVVAPILVLLYDRTFLAGSFRAAWQRRRGLYLGLAASWLVLVALLAQAPRTTTVGFHLPGLSPLLYARTQLGVLVHYLRLACWPHPLAIDYGDWPLARTWGEVAPQAIVVFGLLGLTCWALRRHPAWGFLGAWMVLILAPTSSILPETPEIAAERRMYLPLAALVIGGVIGGWELIGRSMARPRPRALLAAAAAIVLGVLFAQLTIHRNALYQDEVMMLRDLIARRPANARASYNLGIALAERDQQENAKRAFEHAIRLQPAYPEAHANLGMLLASAGDLAGADTHYRQALLVNPALAELQNAVGTLFARQECYAQAIDRFQAALRLKPELSTAARNLEIAEKIRDETQQPDHAGARSCPSLP